MGLARNPRCPRAGPCTGRRSAEDAGAVPPLMSCCAPRPSLRSSCPYRRGSRGVANASSSPGALRRHARRCRCGRHAPGSSRRARHGRTRSPLTRSARQLLGECGPGRAAGRRSSAAPSQDPDQPGGQFRPAHDPEHERRHRRCALKRGLKADHERQTGQGADHRARVVTSIALQDGAPQAFRRPSWRGPRCGRRRRPARRRRSGRGRPA